MVRSRAAHRGVRSMDPTMSLSAIKPFLVRLHRWAALVLAPVFLLIILSGTVLSFRPIVSDIATASAAAGAVDTTALQQLISRLDGGGGVTSISVANGGAAVDVASGSADVAGRWDVQAGTRSAAPTSSVDVFGIAEKLHKSLLLGLGFVVEAASFVMLAIMIIGPFLSLLRFRNSVIGWHRAVGWCLLPLSIIAPLTAVMIVLGIGEGARQPLPKASQPVSIAQALTVAGKDIDLAHLVSARTFRGGTVLLQTAEGSYAVTDAKAVPLTGGKGLVQQIHEGTWAGAWSGALNVVISLILLALTVTGVLSWFRRFRRERRAALPAGGGDLLVAYASQTGTAARLAEATAASLRASGLRPDVASLARLTPEALTPYRAVLLLAASTGEGDVPDSALRFLRALKTASLAGVRFAMLGLGDRSYAHFCGGAETLRTALVGAGAAEIAPLVRVDGDLQADWSRWLADAAARFGLGAVRAEASMKDEGVRLRLAERRRLDDPEAGDTQETWAVTLESEAKLAFRPGDLLRLKPGAGERERSYSIGSSSRVDPRRIELTVRLHRWSDADGRSGFGRMSAALVRTLPLGGMIDGHIEAHPGFNPPGDPSWPILMIATGSGIAPFPGFLAERRASLRAGPAWLIFGNRLRDGDFLWKDRIEAALGNGSLTRLDTAFSRDAGGGRIPERLIAQAEPVRHWLLEDKAIVYICGRREMARDVMRALATILAADGSHTEAAAEALTEEWLAEGRIRIDAFD